MQNADYFPTFAPTPSASLVKTLTAVGNENGPHNFIFGVAQAFDELILVTKYIFHFPMGVEACPTRVFDLMNRSLYDLTKSGRQWRILFVEMVTGYGMEQNTADTCILRLLKEGRLEVVLAVYTLYMDDIFAVAADMKT